MRGSAPPSNSRLRCSEFHTCSAARCLWCTGVCTGGAGVGVHMSCEHGGQGTRTRTHLRAQTTFGSPTFLRTSQYFFRLSEITDLRRSHAMRVKPNVDRATSRIQSSLESHSGGSSSSSSTSSSSSPGCSSVHPRLLLLGMPSSVCVMAHRQPGKLPLVSSVSPADHCRPSEQILMALASALAGTRARGSGHSTQFPV
jgi:hypothetical protein